MLLKIDDDARREGLERAADLFKLHRLSDRENAGELVSAVFANFGIDADAHADLCAAVSDMLPIAGEPVTEALMASSMCAGVLVGLLIADAAQKDRTIVVPDWPPAA